MSNGFSRFDVEMCQVAMKFPTAVNQKNDQDTKKIYI